MVKLSSKNGKAWLFVLICCCADCITTGFQSLTNDTLYFLVILNRTLTCFEKYQQVDHKTNKIHCFIKLC